jgi:Reverse transcriptase (RNA-dependent DNA polymerase)
MVCLLPKKGTARTVKDYTSINLLNCIYKLIARVLTTRFEKVLQRLIGLTQNTFLKGKFILDGVVAAQEILHHIHYTKEQGLLVKLDFEKAFDILNWEYLLESFTSWIHQILNWGRVCINLNGTLTEYFECTNGVRQDDPLSPFLSIFVVEGLNKLINKGVAAGLF